MPFLPGGFDDHELEKLFRFSERVEVQNEDEENYLNPTCKLSSISDCYLSFYLRKFAFFYFAHFITENSKGKNLRLDYMFSY